jgi:hypothetical protein
MIPVDPDPNVRLRRVTTSSVEISSPSLKLALAPATARIVAALPIVTGPEL